MTSNDFLLEVLQSQDYPQNIEQDINVFRQYQELVLDTQRELHRIFEANGIHYQLAYGSLLGAIRDGGQIPWDYDSDLFVPIDERESVIRVLKNHLNPKYHFGSWETDKEYKPAIIRVAPKPMDLANIHVDIFFLCGLPADKEDSKYHAKKIQEYASITRAKRLSLFNRQTDSIGTLVRSFLIKITSLFHSEAYYRRKFFEIVNKYPLHDASYCCPADFFAPQYVLPTDMITNTLLFETSTGQFRIPQNSEDILQRIYGNYQKYPSLEIRINEMYKHLVRLRKYCRIKNNQDIK